MKYIIHSKSFKMQMKLNRHIINIDIDVKLLLFELLFLFLK